MLCVVIVLAGLETSTVSAMARCLCIALPLGLHYVLRDCLAGRRFAQALMRDAS
ncbi:Uncharacterised protein [Pandoraea pulmonicola]|uniref:Uncharacterized protein n=1 Tax=Pandoraea pulmonicola TaxID=93221 RepID=A0AAJ4Z965_PANPU|nr:Uncharacterised protein [Pandoraea pulmonicola]